jgi:hypothetical protein
MKYNIRKIGVWSAIKISFLLNGILGAVIGFFIGVFFFAFGALISQFEQMAAGWSGGADVGPPFLGGILAIILMPIFYAFFMAVFNGIIVTGIAVLLYNILSGAIGGIEIELETMRPAVQYVKPAASQKPASPPPEPPKPGDDRDREPPMTTEGGVDV